PVLIGSEVEPDAQPTFGVAVRAKLADLGATDERWASWKDESGWTVKLEFTADEVEHDARWAFDPRRSSLSPLNADATQLSRQGALPEGLIPRLRAVDAERVSPYKDDSRFDSGAFGPRLLPHLDEQQDDTQPASEHSSAAVQEAAARRAPEESHSSAETADLLEALRRRRGQRESAPLFDDDDDESSGPIALFDAVEEEPEEQAPVPEPESIDTTSGRRKRRNAMPSWDEIVFGARTDE
ncbi:MAG: septation protein SepH, partial [Microbacterium sp.]